MNSTVRDSGRFTPRGPRRFAAYVAALPTGLDVPLFDLYGAGFQRRSSARLAGVVSAMRRIPLDSPEKRIARAWQEVGISLRNAISLYEDGHRDSTERVNPAI